MKAADGAHKVDDADIDLDGIYEIQTALDAQDGGDQGKISLTLDEVQDIDTELQLIASVVRGQVYRIGRKLFVTRDQGGKTPLALFTGRSKSADGEQIHLAMQNESDNDAVIVSWIDRDQGWKQREYQYPEDVVPYNPLRISPAQATWAQAYRRAVFEWRRTLYRRDTLSMEATEEARLIHIGDVINVTDDIANVAQSGGEVFAVAGLVLTLDRETNVSAGGFTIMLRAQDGRAVDSIAVTQGASVREVVLARAPVFAIKGRDDNLGTVYAVYQSAAAVIRPWLVAGIEPQPMYTRINAVNWRTEVFAGDASSLPPVPIFSGAIVLATGLP
jgi:predicted phage tail protein